MSRVFHGKSIELTIGVVVVACLACPVITIAAAGWQTKAYLPLIMSDAPTPTTQASPSPTPQSWWKPTPVTSWQIQFSGELDTTLDVQMYDLDLFDTSQEVFDQIHADGHRVVCYFSAGSWEDWRSDSNQFPASVLGNDLDDWPGERWLDIRQLDILGPIMAARLDLAAQKRCDGVDPDNVDGYTNNTGFPLTAQDQLTYDIWIANQAHARGMSVGLKNDLDQIPDLSSYFDWLLNEQCFQYNECDILLPFIQTGKPVFGIEYQGDSTKFCPRANAMNFNTLKKHLALDAWREACR
jgi:hypothetical protein